MTDRCPCGTHPAWACADWPRCGAARYQASLENLRREEKEVEIINPGHGRLAMTPEEENHRRAEIRVNAEQYVTDCMAIFGQKMPAPRDFVTIVHKVEEPVLRAWGLKP